ncbi:MAG: HAD hydrolase-like protein [Gemmatimonadaceae bacterium]
MIGSLFFEVEGVLASTAALRRAALLRALTDEGLASGDSPDEAADIADDSARDTRDAVRHALRGHAIASDETTLTLIALRADRHFASLVQGGVSLAPGARELLELAASRCRLAIVTGLTRASVDAVLSLAELDGAIEVIIAAEDVGAPKPAPDGYRKALERMNRKRALDITTAIALECGSAGARAAHGAGLRCAVIAPGRETSIACADATLESLVGETPATLGAMLSIRAIG